MVMISDGDGPVKRSGPVPGAVLDANRFKLPVGKINHLN